MTHIGQFTEMFGGGGAKCIFHDLLGGNFFMLFFSNENIKKIFLEI